jgi:predicted metal-dependent peptidase
MLKNAVVKPGASDGSEKDPSKIPADVLEGVESRLRAARTKMLFRKNWSFFGYLAMHLDLQPVAGFGTCATDGDHFIYDPVVLGKESVEWLEFDWAHEVMHLVGLDLSRKPKDDIMVAGVDKSGRPTSNPVSLWNLACDLYNNLKLEEEGFTIPSIVPIDRNYKGWSKDDIYEDLRKKVKQQGQSGVPKGAICGGLCGKPKKRGKGKGDEQQKGSPKPLGGGDVDAWKPSKADEEKWKSRAKEALEASKLKGDAPAFAETTIQKLLQSKLPWRDILWPFCVRTAKEWRYAPPSRTGAARGMVLPRLCPEDEIEHGLFVFDTSGSIGDSNLEEFCGEIEAILNTVRMKATILMVDAAVHKAYHFEPGEFNWKTLEFIGRGGTDFRPAFDWVEDSGVKPTFLVYFTDTYGTFPNPEH